MEHPLPQQPRSTNQRGQDTSLISPVGQHSHCVLCRQVSCAQFADMVTACEMSTCSNCSLRFHACKSEEHALTCQESRVPCVNAGNGCPHVLKRSSMARHLPVCPASVISCSEEWSRWPMHAKEKGVRHSLPSSKTYIDCGQLDVGLAMRDQRMLIDSLKAPRRLKRSLRNPLTQKYPAAPLTQRRGSLESDPGASGDTSQTVSDDESDAPWDLSRPHPGLKESIRGQLFQVTKEVTDNMTSALNLNADKVPNKGNTNEQGIDDEVNDHCSQMSINVSSTENNANESNKEHLNSPKGSLRESLSSECVSDMSSSRSRSVSVLRDVGGTQLHKIIGGKLIDGNDSDICLHKLLGVNLTSEVINKYVTKPPSMYTFICAQNFRRDEYKWHFKNIHQEIHPDFGGWIEQRCPLAYLGCTFSFQRLIPEQKDVVLYHSWLQESFGLKSVTQPLHLSSDNSHCNCSDPSEAAVLESTSRPQSASNLKAQDIQDSGALKSTELPSISDLADFDRTWENPNPSFSPCQNNVDAVSSDIASNSKPDITSQTSRSKRAQSESGHESDETPPMVSVRPVIFTAVNADSKVVFHYNLEETKQCPEFVPCSALTDLPFEVLQVIAKHLDSFSLCNLSLTCRRLREVCCSLLDDHGIVVLNWERQKNGDKVSWQVSNKRWMFSTSFEPIKSWRFNPDCPSVAEHLKICPFNKDCNTHSGHTKVLIS